MKRVSQACLAAMLKPSRGVAAERGVDRVERGERLLEHQRRDLVRSGRPRGRGRGNCPASTRRPSSSRQRISTSSESTASARKSILGWNAQPMRRSRIACAQRIFLARALALARFDLGLEQPARRLPVAPRFARRRLRLAPQTLGASRRRRGQKQAPAAALAKISTPSTRQGSLARAAQPPASREQRRGRRRARRRRGRIRRRRRARRDRSARLAGEPLADLRRQRLAGRGAVKGDDFGETVDARRRRRRTARPPRARRSGRRWRGRRVRDWAGRSKRRNRRARTDRPACAAARRCRTRRRRNSRGRRTRSRARSIELGAAFDQPFEPAARVRQRADARRRWRRWRATAAPSASRTSRPAPAASNAAAFSADLRARSRGAGRALENLRAQLLEPRRRRVGVAARRAAAAPACRAAPARSSTGARAARGAAPALDHLAHEAALGVRPRSSQSSSRKVSLCGRRSGGSSVKRSRVGNGRPSPNATTSRVPSEGTKASRLATASVTAERSSAWSRSLAIRIANSVLHCEMMVGSSSPGRWVTRPR